MNRIPWTPEEDLIIRELYPHLSSNEIAKKLRRPISSIYNRANGFGIHKSEEFKKSELSGGFQKGKQNGGSKFKFPKGHKPWNHGMKGLQIGGTQSQFKKGRDPHNTKYDGCITIRKETTRTGELRPYKWIRLSKAKWQQLHVYNWEAVNGKVPKGHIVVFINGDTMNCDPSNLRCITNKEHMLETQQKDGYIATQLARTPGKGKFDEVLRDEILKQPELLEAKRKQLQLNSIIKNYESENSKNDR